MKGLENKEGIMLIAMIITIIILLILVGVSLSFIAGENGILGRVTTAVDRTKKETAREELKLAISDVKMGWYEEGRTGSLKDYMIRKLNDYPTANGTIICDDAGNVTYTGNGVATGKINDNGNFILTGAGSSETPKDPERPSILGELEVGSTVSYSPSGNYQWKAMYTSSDLAVDGTADIDLNSEEREFQITSWKVLSINEATGKVQMLPSAPTSGTVRLQGPQGYNNAVKLLNEACSNLYSDSSKGITARSINIEDIEGCMTEVGIEARDDYTNTNDSIESVKYGDRHKIVYSGYRDESGAYTTYKNYPVIYEREEDSKIDGNQTEGTLGLSGQEQFIERREGTVTTSGRLGLKTANISIHPKQTYYSWDYSTFRTNLEEVYQNLLLPNSSRTSYWVASRCVDLRGDICDFDVYYVDSENLGGHGMCHSGSYPINGDRSLFPVITLSAKLIGRSKTGGFTVE